MNEIIICKKQRELALRDGGRTLLRCAVGLGPAPAGHKSREGDGKTPEGRYAVCTRNAASRYTLFLGLDYPSPNDAQAAFARGQITAAQLAAIALAHQNGARPPWDTPLGGQIGIHGGGIFTGAAPADSTAGCIALSDADIRALWPLAPLGTPVLILP